jgi:hypothetical protein
MPYQLTFAQMTEYDTAQPGVTITASLRLGKGEVTFDAKIDTGSTNCVFSRNLGEKLGLDIESGLPKWIATATGRFLTYEHEVTLSVRGFDFFILACFAEDDAFQRNVLGRHGFLVQVKLGLVDYQSKLYLDHFLEE